MAPPRPATIDAYIAAAPAAGQPHLRQLHALLQGVAPKAERVIKWGWQESLEQFAALVEPEIPG